MENTYEIIERTAIAKERNRIVGELKDLPIPKEKKGDTHSVAEAIGYTNALTDILKIVYPTEK